MTNPFGFLIIDKPKGLTSHDCVNTIRKVFGIRRVGHGGTLDPSATGVLPIALGNATRLFPYFPGEKTYRAIIQLGKITTTDDLQGEIISQNKIPKLKDSDLENCLDNFRGTIYQKPPNISSIHFKGERAYKRARRGEIFTLPERKVNIYNLSLLNWSIKTGQVEISVNCSSGTYIRSIARDLGSHIGCGGFLYKLRRTEALGFSEKKLISLPKFNPSDLTKKPTIINPLSVLEHLKQMPLLDDDLRKWRKGQKIALTKANLIETTIEQGNESSLEKYILLIDSQNQIAGIGELLDSDIIKPKVVFNADG